MYIYIYIYIYKLKNINIYIYICNHENNVPLPGCHSMNLSQLMHFET